MSTKQCPITEKVTNKLVSELQDILVLLNAQDTEGRLDFLKFRSKVVRQFGRDTFTTILTKANGSNKVENSYYGTND